MPKRDTIMARHNFSRGELNDIAARMAEKLHAAGVKEEERKTVASQFKVEIDALQAEINLLSECYRNGWEMRHMTVEVEKDYDAKERRYRSIDTGEIVKVEPLQPDDYQTDAFPEIEQAVETLRESLGEGNSMTIESGDQSVTIEGKGHTRGNGSRKTRDAVPSV